MSDSASSVKIGFPPNTLCPEPIRLEVFYSKPSSFSVLDKPAGLLLETYPGAPAEKSIMQAMRDQGAKPEFKRLGMDAPYAVNHLDFETSGAAIVACNKDSATSLRNALWSGHIDFEYLLLAKAGEKHEPFEAELPLLMHEERPVWIVSHRFGKKAKTSFEPVEILGAFALWRAKTKMARPHQIRVHAAESGLKVIGERIYSKTPCVYMSDLKKDLYKIRSNADEKPFYPFVCVHLNSLSLDAKEAGFADGEKIEVSAPLPKGFATCLKRLGFKKFK